MTQKDRNRRSNKSPTSDNAVFGSNSPLDRPAFAHRGTDLSIVGVRHWIIQIDFTLAEAPLALLLLKGFLSNEIVETGSLIIAGRWLPVTFQNVFRSRLVVMRFLLSTSTSDTAVGRTPAGSLASISLIKLVNLDKRPVPYSTG